VIYIVQEFYDGKWWHESFYTQKFHAEEKMRYLDSLPKSGSYRIKEFPIPED
jgi:hypothetical protein